MVSLSEEKEIYSEIQKRLFYIIPEKWESIYLYASVTDGPNNRTTGELYFYYFPKGIIKKKVVNCYEIPNAFNIDENEYLNLINNLYNEIKKLRKVFISKRRKKWYSITISIENYKFKVEYDYQKITDSEFDSYERHIIWRYNYLKPDISLLDKKDKKIINNYLNYISMNKLPKKDIYMEGIYKQPVKNIVDFEKTLTVEEAIAQSENDEPKERKKKHHLFRKKQIIEDIIEMDDEDLTINNQILNWKKDK